MNKLLKILQEHNYHIISSEILQISENTIKVNSDLNNKILILLEKLDCHEDVQKIHSNFEIN